LGLRCALAAALVAVVYCSAGRARGAAAEGVSPTPNVRRVAVLDFGLDETADDADDRELSELGRQWLVGLPEYIETSLLEAGVSLVERRALGPLLQERRLTRTGLMRDGYLGQLTADGRSAHPMLRADLLLEARLAVLPQQRFVIVATLTHWQDGSQVRRASAEGAYPHEWVSAWQTVVTDLAAFVQEDAPVSSQQAPGPRPEADDPAGQAPWTRVPESVMLYHKGMAYLAADDLPQALAYLNEAWRRGYRFYIARAWEARAWDRAGFPDISAYMWHELRGYLDPQRDAALIAATDAGLSSFPSASVAGEGERPTNAGGQDKPVSVIVSTAIVGHLPQRFADEFLQALAADSAITIRDASALTGSIREHDLQLTNALSAADRAAWDWLAVTAQVVVRADAKGGVRVSAFDAINGQALGPDVVTSDPAAAADHWRPRLLGYGPPGAAKGGIQRRKADPVRRPAANGRVRDYRPHWAPIEPDEQRVDLPSILPPTPATWYSPANSPLKKTQGLQSVEHTVTQTLESARVPEQAALIALLLDEPNNLDVLNSFYNIGNRPVSEATAARVVALIDRDRNIPNAPAWLMYALFQQFENWFHENGRESAAKMLIEPRPVDRYAKLIAWFGDSGPARLVNFAEGCELINEGKREQGLQLIERLIDELPGLTLPEPFDANKYGPATLFFVAGREAFRAGRLQQARTWYDRCRQALGPDSYRLTANYELVANRASDRAAWYVGPLPKTTHRQSFVQMQQFSKEIFAEVEDLGRRLAAAEAGGPPAGPYLTARELLVKAMAATHDEAFALQIDSVRAFLRERREGASFPERVRLQLAWLRAHAYPAPRRADLQRLADDLLKDAKLNGGDRRILWLLTDRLDLAEEANQRALKSSHLGLRLDGVRQLVELNSLRYRLPEQARRLVEEIDALRKLEGVTGDAPTLATCLIAETFGPLLMRMGRFDEAVSWRRAAFANADLPRLYRVRAARNLAGVLAATGQPFEASELLRTAVHELENRPSETFTWNFEEGQSRSMFHGLRGIWPQTSDQLLDAAYADLKALRLYDGFGEAFPRPATSGGDGHPGGADHADGSDDRVEPGLLYALAYLYNLDLDRWSPWLHQDWWIREAEHAINRLPPEVAEAVLSRLIEVQHLHADNKLQENQRWCALMLLARRHIDLAPQRLELINQIRWSATCEVHRYGAVLLGEMGATEAAPALALMAGKTCETCSRDARRALRQLDTPRSQDVPLLARLLDHAELAVRREAAELLARYAPLVVSRDAAGDIDEAGATDLRQWYRQLQRDVPDAMLMTALNPHDRRRPPELRTSAFVREGRQLVTGDSDGFVSLWDLSTLEAIRRWRAHRGVVASLVTDADRARVATCGHDLMVRVHDLETGRLLMERPHPLRDAPLTLLPGGGDLLVGAGDELERIRIADGTATPLVPWEATWYGFTPIVDPQGRTVLAQMSEGVVERWDLATGRSQGRRQVTFAGIESLVFIDADLFLSACGDRRLYLWRWSDGRIVKRFAGHRGYPWSARMSPDRRFVVSWDLGGAYLWDNRLDDPWPLRFEPPGQTINATFDSDDTFTLLTDRGVLETRRLPDATVLQARQLPLTANADSE
jgi:tetratricopeptide (TPR) repeat protein